MLTIEGKQNFVCGTCHTYGLPASAPGYSSRKNTMQGIVLFFLKR